MSGHHFEPHALDADDEGYDSTDFGTQLRSQDEAFCSAMREAIDRKKENAVEGIKIVPRSEARALRSLMLPATFVPSRSSLENA